MTPFLKLLLSFLLTLVIPFFGQRSAAQVPVSVVTFQNMFKKEVPVDSMDTFLESQMKKLKVPGLSIAIINDGKVVYHRTKGYADLEESIAVTDKTIFEGASLSKPLFAYFIMGFVEEGLLDLDTPLYRYLPYEDIAYDERYKKITARMVLSHSSGFPNWRTDYEDDRLFIKFEPGTAFEYSGEGFQYLAKVLMHLLQTNDAGLEKVYQKRIAIPLGMTYTKFLQDEANMTHKAEGYVKGKTVGEDDDPGTFGAAFSVHSEALDFSKWMITLIDKEGLTAAGHKALFESQIVLPKDHPQSNAGVTDWTLGFAKVTLPQGTLYGHGGNNPGYTSLFALSQETRWGFVIFTNANQSNLPMALLQYLMTR